MAISGSQNLCFSRLSVFIFAVFIRLHVFRSHFCFFYIVIYLIHHSREIVNILVDSTVYSPAIQRLQIICFHI